MHEHHPRNAARRAGAGDAEYLCITTCLNIIRAVQHVGRGRTSPRSRWRARTRSPRAPIILYHIKLDIILYHIKYYIISLERALLVPLRRWQPV
jgi:hypothetical protein